MGKTFNKHVLLIGNDRTENDTSDYYGSYTSFFEKSFKRAALSASIDWTLLQDLYIEVGDGIILIVDTKTGKELSHFDTIIIRGMGFRSLFDVLKTVSVYGQEHNINVINDYSAFRDSSKLTQAVQFYEAGLPVAKTVYVNRVVLEGNHTLGVTFPCIMKAVFGSHGNDNHVVHSLADVRTISSQSSARFVLQRLVPNNGDYRILVVGSDVRCIERVAATGSHLNNTSQGGSARLITHDKLPIGMVDGARKIMERLDMSIAGVDALTDNETGDYFFLEVNSQPQLMTGAYTEEKEQLVGEYFTKLFSESE